MGDFNKFSEVLAHLEEGGYIEAESWEGHTYYIEDNNLVYLDPDSDETIESENSVNDFLDILKDIKKVVPNVTKYKYAYVTDVDGVITWNNTKEYFRNDDDFEEYFRDKKVKFGYFEKIESSGIKMAFKDRRI